MAKNKEEKQEVKQESLLSELCGNDSKLYEFLGEYLLEHPLEGISKKDLESLMEEAEKSGNFRPAVDKAIFECSQKPAEKERYIKVIQNLASKTKEATEKEKERVEKQGLTDRAASLERRIQDQKFMGERTEEIINVASKFYNEKLLELGENTRREQRKTLKTQAQAQGIRTEQAEQAGREARKKEEKKMGKDARREAEIQDKKEELAAEARKEERREKIEEDAREETRIGDQEKAGQEARKKERKGM
jgi:hypothetical protein